MKNHIQLKLYRVIPKYIDVLRDESKGGDSRVYKVREGKEHRPFIGIITECNGQKYCIPLSTYKPKFKNIPNSIDFSKIIINNRIVGAIEFSRMIPVEDNVLRPLDMKIHIHDTDAQKASKALRNAEIEYIHVHGEDIENKAKELYNKYISGEPFKRKKDCLNFPELEKLCKQYCVKHPAQYYRKDIKHVFNKESNKELEQNEDIDRC